jgi:PKD repeat protein
LGYVLPNYDSIVVLFPNMADGGRITYGGLGTIGGQHVWLHNTISTRIWGHELGHNLGAGHSAFWEPTDPWAVIGPADAGIWYEYGNPVDLMGGADLAGGDFSAYWKRELGWLPDGTQVIPVDAGGSYDLYAVDQGAAAADRVYALRVPRQPGQDYWLEHRAASGIPGIDHGLVFQWRDANLGPNPALLDLTPQSRPGDYRADLQDAALPIARTYSDWEAQLHITPLVRHTTAEGDYLTVVIQRGPFPGNLPPSASLALSSENVSVGQPLTLTATAGSVDGDLTVIAWDFGDGTLADTLLDVQHVWTEPGQYPVRLAVSDTKGGLTELMAVVHVGPRSLLAVAQPERTRVVHADTAQDQVEPAVASDGQNRLVVVWQSDEPGGTGIYGRRLLADGTAVGEPFVVPSTTGGDRRNPAVVMSADGDFVVVWQGTGAEGTSEIYARRFRWDGGPVGDEFRVNTETFGTQQDPAVSLARDTGDVVVAWSSNVIGRHVRYRRYAADGTAQDAQEQVAAGGRHFSAVDVAQGPGGDFVLAWDNDTRVEGGDDLEGLAVFAQRFGGDGSPATGVLQVHPATAGDQQRPRVAMDGQGGFAVVWESAGQDGDGLGVFLRNFAADGSAVAPVQQVNQTTAADQSSPALAIDALGRRIVSWRDGRENYVSSSDGHLAQRLLAADGTPLTPESRVLGVQTDFFSGPDVAAVAGSDGFVLVNPEHQDADGVDVRARYFLLVSPPWAVADQVRTPQGQAVLVDALANDLSPHGGPLQLTVVLPPGAGTVVVEDNGTPLNPRDDRFRYTPPSAAFRGTVGFAYQLTDAAGAAGLGIVTIQVGLDTGPEGDADGDGVSDAVEAAAPNGGDGNADGIPDSQQAGVASLPNAVDGGYLTVSVPAGLELRNVASLDPATLPGAPSSVDFPLGAFRIEIAGLSPGQSQAATLRWHSAAGINTAYRLAPGGDPPGDWSLWLYQSVAAVGSQIYADRIVAHWVDGAPGDEDGIVDGAVLAVVAPAITFRPWQNPVLPQDVDGDGEAKPLDVLMLINEINRNQSRVLPASPGANEVLPPFWDVDGDGQLAPADVLNVINYLNRPERKMVAQIDSPVTD